MGTISSMFEVRSASHTLKDPALADLFGGRPTKSGQYVTPETAMRVSAVYACVTILAQTLAMLPKHIKGIRDDGGKDILKNHRLYKLIHSRPNRWQSSFEFFEMLEGHRLLRGNAYAKIIFNPGRQQNELVPLHPDHVWPFVITPEGVTYYVSDNSPCPPDGSLWYQHFPQNGGTEILSAEEVMHIRGYSVNGITGLGVIKRAAQEAIGLAMAAEEHGASMMANGAKIPLVLSHPQTLKQDAFERLKAQVREGGEYAGSGNAGKTMILEGGMSVEKIGMTADELQFLETRKFQVEDIARIFNVPLILIGHGDKASTYASAEQFFMSFKVHTVSPNVCRWEGATERSLLYPSEVGKVEVDFDMDSMMRGDAVSRAQYLKSRFEMASITPDGVCLYEGENPTGTEEGKQLYLQSGMMPAKMAGQKPLAPGAAKDVKK
jgi:HK97 family phage portal protein